MKNTLSKIWGFFCVSLKLCIIVQFSECVRFDTFVDGYESHIVRCNQGKSICYILDKSMLIIIYVCIYVLYMYWDNYMNFHVYYTPKSLQFLNKMFILYMLNTPSRSTFHQTVLSGDVRPIKSALIHVSVFPSTALLAS